MTSKAKSVKSAKPLKTVRNVLVQPFKTQWPCVQLSEAGNLVNLLKQIPKDQVVHGTSPVNHLLSKGLACAFLISSDFHPQILGKQIIQMARRNSPGIQLLALECLSWNGKLEKLVAIRKTSNQYPEKVIELLNLMMKIGESKGYDTESSKFSSGGNRKLMAQQTKVENMSQEEIERLYLPRSTNGKRAFVPQVSIFAGKQTVEAKKDDWGQFVSFKRSGADQIEINLKGKSKRKEKSSASTKANINASEGYVPLTVNRLQGNPNRKSEKSNIIK
ncbi:uncharacterized protein LOC135714557 isoform X2 [Ochlerotatus camptorhynchus]|uniref:uncharacterized protein LOC135714557 isoform X2 n=1 Tax=Ochlerotatus camptorhynchus TaxID=644619 RepID=UPI0031D10F6E